MSIQQSINSAIGSAAKATMAAKTTEAAQEAAKAAEAGRQAAEAKKAATEAANAKKAADQQNLKALGAIEEYQATAKKAQGAEQMVGESANKQASIAAKIEEQRQKMQQDGLTARQVAGHKGRITRMREAIAAVDEERQAREYQAKLLEKRKQVLRDIHGEAWKRMGIDPKGGQEDGE